MPCLQSYQPNKDFLLNFLSSEMQLSKRFVISQKMAKNPAPASQKSNLEHFTMEECWWPSDTIQISHVAPGKDYLPALV